MKSRLVRDGAVVVPVVHLASSLPDRMRGLLGKRDLPVGEGLHIAPCSSIHTWFMRFDLDVFFLDRDYGVVRIVRGVRPFRAVLGGAGAHSVVEVATGWLAADALREGAHVAFERVDV